MTEKRKIKKSWWVNVYDQNNQLVVGNPYPHPEHCRMMANNCSGKWLGVKEVVFEYEEEEGK